MPAPGSHYSQWKLGNVLLFKQKSECVVQLQQYETDMAKWHGAIQSCLVKTEALEKAGREKGTGSILARHEARLKRPLKNIWGIEKQRDREDGMRCTEVWQEVWTKTFRDVVWPGDVRTLLRPWITQHKSEVQWAALWQLESHFTSPPLRFPAPKSLPAHQISTNKELSREREKEDKLYCSWTMRTWDLSQKITWFYVF